MKKKKPKDWDRAVEKLGVDKPLHFKIGTVLVRSHPFSVGKIFVEIKEDGMHIRRTA